MRAYVISHSDQIQALCRAAVQERFGATVIVDCFVSPDVPLDADLYLWDIVPDRATLSRVCPEDFWRHFIFADAADVQTVCQSIPLGKGNILLKPVAAGALRAFLANTCVLDTVEPLPTPGSIHGDRSDLLQYVLQANLKLQEYDHDRTRFLARAIHDFRAPLTAISGYCSLLLAEDLGPLTNEQREVAERMQRSAKKLSRMASAMFQLSIAPRMEASLDLQPGDLRDCVDQAIHEILPFAQDKRLTISSDTEHCDVPVWFDRTKIEQVLVNLLDNACKFTPRGGTIAVSGGPLCWDRRSASNGPASAGRAFGMRSPNAYLLAIRDSGPGIAPEHLPTIFEEYTSYRGGADRSGGGLGLAVCRMIVDQHNGAIWAHSDESGAVFTFVLPLYRAASQEPPVNSQCFNSYAVRS
jgi:signal transduction histidine kinase